MRKNIFGKLYLELRRKYGRPQGQWKLWCKRPKTEKDREEVILGAILTQRTNWKNVEMAIKNLKEENKCLLKSIRSLTFKRLGFLIKSSGFYKTKTKYLISLIKFVLKKYGSVAKMKKQDTEKLREELFELKGIGPETADSILLYALDKSIFVIDEYTRRLVKKRKITQNLSYEFLRELFEKNLRRDFKVYQDFHALIVIDGKNNKN